MTAEYHVRQLTGSACGKRNCAAASAAMAIHFESAGRVQLSADQVRTASRVSCIPGEHSASGGLFISDVERVAGLYGVSIDYGRVAGIPRRWPASELERRLVDLQGGVLVGDYDALPERWRASPTFLGDHSVFVHGIRRRVRVGLEVHWHDPLRKAGIWIPLAAAIAYWQKPNSPVRGYAGWVAPRKEDKPVIGFDVVERFDGTVSVKTDGRNYAYLNLETGRLVDITPPFTKEAYVLARLDADATGKGPLGSGDARRVGYLIGVSSAFVLATDVDPHPRAKDCSAEIAADRSRARIVYS